MKIDMFKVKARNRNHVTFGDMTQEYWDDKELYEGLITSVSRDKIKNYLLILEKQFNNIELFHDEKLPYIFSILYKFEDPETSKKLYDDLIQKLNVFGWYVSLTYFGNTPLKKENVDFSKFKKLLTDNHVIELVIEPKYDTEISEYPLYFYHVTSYSDEDEKFKGKLNKILRVGLSPRTENKIADHPERIYFTMNLQDAKEIRFSLIRNSKQSRIYRILKIKTNALLMSTKFYVDPNFTHRGTLVKGIFTLSNIPPEAITVIED